MSYCSKCGRTLDKDALFCPGCGTPAGRPRVQRESRRNQRSQRKPMSTLTIVIIILLIVGGAFTAVLATTFYLGLWHPFGQVVGSDNLVTQEKSFSDFSIIKVESGFEVEIIQSGSYSITITADDNVIDYVEVSKTSDLLTIRPKWGYNYQSVTLRANIRMPELHKLELSGGTQGTSEGFNTSQNLVLELSGGSSLRGEFTTTENVEFTISSGSQIPELDGAAKDLHLSASSGSHLDLSGFQVQNANIDLSGGSHTTINLEGRLDADLSGGSQLLYIGNPSLGTIDTSGGSTVSQK